MNQTKNSGQEIRHYVYTAYDMEGIKKIYINSDGGAWIKEE